MDFYMAIAIVFATLFGPILAVYVTRVIDRSRERRHRQTEVFRALMRSRRANLSPDYVNALNIVEIEFSGVDTVESAHRDLFRHLNIQSQLPDWPEALRRLQTRLMYAIAVHLGYRMEQLDVLEGGYTPVAWGNIEDNQRAILKALAELLSGTRTLPVEIIPSPGPNNVLPLNPAE
jgi:hypothetical protein